MLRASKLPIFIIFPIVLVLTSFFGLLLTSEKAEASVPKPATPVFGQMFTNNTQYQSGSLGVAAARPFQSPSNCETVTGAVPIIGDDIGGIACPVVDGVIGAVTTGVDCIADIEGCVTGLIKTIGYDLIGGVIGWSVDGIVSLVAGQREECLTGGGAGTDTQNLLCESRIQMDYFPRGSIAADDKADTLKVSAQALVDRYTGLVNSTSNADLKAEYTEKLQEAQQTLDNISQANGTATGADALFYVPKSPIASEKWDREYLKYGLIGFMLMVPMLIAAALQSVITGKPFLLFRSIFLVVPASIFGIALAPFLVRTMMVIIDGFCAIILQDTKADVQGFFSSQGTSGAAIAGAASSIFLMVPYLLVALIFAFGAMLIWFVLSMREASVALIAVFLPIAFAASIWPALSKWALRAIKLLMAAIISKVFIVGALALGIGVMGGSAGSTPGNGSYISFSNLIYGATIFFIAAFSPHLVMKFFDEIGDAINAAGGTGAVARGLNAAANANGTRTLLGREQGLSGMLFGRTGGGGGGGGGGGDLGGLAAGMAVANRLGSGTPTTPGELGQIGGGASRATPGTRGGDHARAGASGSRAGGGSLEDNYNAAAREAWQTAQQELGPGASNDAIAARAGQYMGEGAQAEGLNRGQAQQLARETTAAFGGSAAAQRQAAGSIQGERHHGLKQIGRGLVSPISAFNNRGN